MAYEFEKLSEVGSLDEFPEGAKVLIEHDGDIKRCAADSLGGGGGYHWIHLEMDTETEEITCDEEITFESLREDIANGIMPAVVIDDSYEDDYETSSFFQILKFSSIEEGVYDNEEDGEYEEWHRAMFGQLNDAVIYLDYINGQYVWGF